MSDNSDPIIRRLDRYLSRLVDDFITDVACININDRRNDDLIETIKEFFEDGYHQSDINLDTYIENNWVEGLMLEIDNSRLILRLIMAAGGRLETMGIYEYDDIDVQELEQDFDYIAEQINDNENICSISDIESDFGMNDDF